MTIDVLATFENELFGKICEADEACNHKTYARRTHQSTAQRISIMTQDGRQTILSEREASQGIKLGHMRYVLMISLLLCVTAGILILFFQ